MDPLTHLAAPAAAASACGARGRAVFLAAFGGLLPDLEKGLQLLLTFFPGSHFLYFKHGGTHTLLGAALLCLSACLFLPDHRRSGFGFLYLGAFTHLVLDTIHLPWSMRVLRPFSVWVIPSKTPFWSLPLQVALLTASIAILVSAWRRGRLTRGSTPPP